MSIYHQSMTAAERKQYDEVRTALLALHSALVTLDRQAKQANPRHVRRFYSRKEQQERANLTP